MIISSNDLLAQTKLNQKVFKFSSVNFIYLFFIETKFEMQTTKIDPNSRGQYRAEEMLLKAQNKLLGENIRQVHFTVEALPQNWSELPEVVVGTNTNIQNKWVKNLS